MKQGKQTANVRNQDTVLYLLRWEDGDWQMASGVLVMFWFFTWGSGYTGVYNLKLNYIFLIYVFLLCYTLINLLPNMIYKWLTNT